MQDNKTLHLTRPNQCVLSDSIVSMTTRSPGSNSSRPSRSISNTGIPPGITRPLRLAEFPAFILGWHPACDPGARRDVYHDAVLRRAHPSASTRLGHQESLAA